jgi:hypothetical protein
MLFAKAGVGFTLRYKKVGSTYKFLGRSTFDRIMAPIRGLEQAHHMIALAARNNNIVQLAARAGWHINHFGNGINLPLSIHNNWDAAHSLYNQRLLTYLNNNINNITTPQQAKTFLIDLQTSIRQQFNAGKKLDEIIF